MKKTLEYKILKYLSKNNSLDFINVAPLESNFELIQSTVNVLKLRNLLEHKLNPKGVKDEKGTSRFPEILDCKITLLGREYLSNINKSTIEVDLAESNIISNKQNTRFSKINIGFMIFNAIFVIANIMISIYRK
ncbi:hypothetical protein MPF19_18435 [Polaribacter sp. Z014]|uniref:hypothetical protein n=1 Tax=Polaribacter sp. Z014 TaxID=2927126 RepID=UPI002020BF73|nr:hypothetical protein [Polaribacter sp. Z014]MCL7765402.1 hypothetical protein [Polaribacter sp. Z014]